MDFPGLDDTNFPNIDTVDVWKYKNNFDYKRWVANTKIKLTSVLWNADYSDVVKFENDKARDEYFDSLDDYSITLQTIFRITPEGNIDLPIPYAVLSKYNYLYVDRPVATTPDNPIEYENPNRRVERFFYFINQLTYIAPNNTRCNLQLDVWTTWINQVNIPYMFLWRGHAPVAATSTDTFLSNPINNNQYLLTDDISIDQYYVTQNSKFQPINAGTPYLCIASTITPEYMQSIGVISGGPESWSAPTYSDRDIRWGKQQNVDGYSFGSTSINGASNTYPLNYRNNIPYVTTYALPISTAKNDLRTISRNAPHFMESIQSSFILGDDVISFGNTYQIAGINLMQVIPKNSNFNIRITKDMYNYPTKYQRFAKLYTSQYSTIEITDNNGHTSNVKIEQTGGSFSGTIFSNIAYPLLNINVIFSGINGTGSTNYKWQNVDKNMQNGDISEFMLEFGIPTYSLYQESSAAYLVNNAYANNRTRADAVTNYKNKVGDNNVIDKNNNDLAETQKQNQYNIGDTIEKNINNTMDTHVTNTENTNNTIVNNTALAGNATLANMTTSNDASKNSTNSNNALLVNQCSEDVQASITTTAQENNYTSISTSNNNAAKVSSSKIDALNSIATGVASVIPNEYGGGVLAGIANAVQGIQDTGIETANASANSSISISTNSAIVANVSVHNAAKAGWAERNNTDVVDYSIQAKHDNTVRNVNTNNTQASNSARTNNTNADNDKTTNNTNAANNNTTTHTNADNLRNVYINNNDYLNNEKIEEAKRSLENSQNITKTTYNLSKVQPPIQIGTYTGYNNGIEGASFRNMDMQGFQVRVKTPPLGKLAIAGDYFARFGYNLEQIWEINKLQVMKYFTYWKARDIWVNIGEGTNDIAEVAISDIFRNGVTVWSNPNLVGKVSIYDNW